MEFIAQTLQIGHARRFGDLRTRSTVEALQRLSDRGLITLADFEALTQAYGFLRCVEKAMRRADDQARNVLPTDPRALRVLARSMGFEGGGPFLEAVRSQTEENRVRFERLVGPVPKRGGDPPRT